MDWASNEPGQVIASWTEDDDSPLTITYSACGDVRWIACPELGAIRFTAEQDSVTYHPVIGVNFDTLVQYASRRWLPRVYNYWGFQVLHAAAVYHRNSHTAVAFCAPTLIGKSTLAYAMGRRHGWAQLTDDVMALDQRDGGAFLKMIPSMISLRTRTAQHFGEVPFSFTPLPWPDVVLRLSTIFLLEAVDAPDASPAVVPVNPADGYVALLKQAFIVSENDADARRRLAVDYLQLMNAVTLYRLIYPRAFEKLDATLDLVEAHAQTIES
ncbi:MAG: hypothetical protein KJ065_16455 [Anaerolineae bacterium]|nr:hypothetical protein [Anaerolineae bacterium]